DFLQAQFRDNIKYEEDFFVNSRGNRLFTCRWMPKGHMCRVPCFSCSLPDAPIRFVEPISLKTPLMVIEGNHEIELQGRQGDLRIILGAIRCSMSLDLIQNFTLLQHWWHHFIMLGAYIGYNNVEIRVHEARKKIACTDIK
ncbi:unnamed protein product, partial [Urochloa humidicola]